MTRDELLDLLTTAALIGNTSQPYSTRGDATDDLLTWPCIRKALGDGTVKRRG